MATIQNINIGAAPNDNTVDTIRVGGQKINDNFSNINSELTNTAKLNVAQEYTQQQNFNATTLTDAANISWDLNTNQVAKVTPTGTRILDNPTNMKDGATYILTKLGTGSLTFGSAYKWPGGTAPTFTSGTDIMTFISDGTSMYGVVQTNFS